MITAMQTSTCRTSILSRSWPGKLWIFHHKSKLLLHEHVAWQERWASICINMHQYASITVEKDPSNRSDISAAWELNTEIFLRFLWTLFFSRKWSIHIAPHVGKTWKIVHGFSMDGDLIESILFYTPCKAVRCQSHYIITCSMDIEPKSVQWPINGQEDWAMMAHVCLVA